MTSEQHLLAVGFACGESSLRVRRFMVDEDLSRLFSVSILAVSEKPDIDLAAITGKPASFRLTTDNPTVPERMWSGLCNHAEQVQAEVGGQSDASEGLSTYFIHLVPSLWVTTQRLENRIFQQQTLPEIVQSILTEWKIQARWELKYEPVNERNAKGDQSYYKKHDYVVQYGETDFAFINRLLETAGITFYFRFTADTETQLIFADQPHQGAGRGGLPLRFVDTPTSNVTGEYATAVRLIHNVTPGAVTIRDYDFRQQYNSVLQGTSSEKVSGPEDFYEQYCYRPGASLIDLGKADSPNTPLADDRGIYARHSENEANELAQRRLRALRKHKRQVHFETNCPDLAPGVLFSLREHPRPELAQQGDKARLLVANAYLEGHADGQWNFGGTALLTDYPYVPDNKTAKPRIFGMQSAIVVGQAGEEIHTDEFGRVRVQFHWDREGQYDEHSSCWLPVSQDWAGCGYGSLMLPRVGQEVLVGFYEGDPDRPVVLGRVYNELTKVPYQLPKHQTRSTFKTDSTPNSDGFNELMFEDKQGEELVYLQAERDLQKLVKQYETTRVGQNQVSIVGAARSAVIGELEATMVGGRYFRQIVSPPAEADLQIQEQKAPSFSPTETTMEMVNERIIFTTGQATVAFEGDNLRLQADKDIVIHAASGDVILEGGHVYINDKAPTPAPAPDPFEPLTPGTYSSDAADKLESLAAQLRREKAAIDLTAPKPPKYVAEKQTPTQIECELLDTDLFCQHDGRRPSDDGILQVVPAAAGDQLTLAASINGQCGEHPEWKITGPDGTETLVGDKQQVIIPGWDRLSGSGAKLSFKHLAEGNPRTYRVVARSCSGITASYDIWSYPLDQYEFTLKRALAGDRKQLPAVVGVISKFLKLVGQPDAAKKLDAADPGRGELSFGAMGAEMKVEWLQGQASVSGQWAEWSTDHRAYWQWALAARLDPLLGITGTVPITPHLPFPLNKIGDAFLFIELSGKVAVQAKAERKSPDTVWKAKPVLEAEGSLGVKAGAQLQLLSKDTLCVRAYGETTISVVASYANRGPVDPPAIDFVGKWSGFQVALTVESSNWISKWVKKYFSGSEGKKQWTIVEGGQRQLGTWQLGNPPSDEGKG